MGSIRINVVNTATLIYNHPCFCQEGDYQMCAAYCYKTFGLKPSKMCYDMAEDEKIWGYVMDELDFMVTLGEPKKAKGTLIPNQPKRLTLEDMPFDILDKVYATKHKLELTSVLGELTKKHKYAKSINRQMRAGWRARVARSISETTYSGMVDTLSARLAKREYRPFGFVDSKTIDEKLIHEAHLASYVRNAKSEKYITLAYSRLLQNNQEKCYLHKVPRNDLVKLCRDNGLSPRSKDSMKKLIQLLLSV